MPLSPLREKRARRPRALQLLFVSLLLLLPLGPVTGPPAAASDPPPAVPGLGAATVETRLGPDEELHTRLELILQRPGAPFQLLLSDRLDPGGHSPGFGLVWNQGWSFSLFGYASLAATAELRWRDGKVYPAGDLDLLGALGRFSTELTASVREPGFRGTAIRPPVDVFPAFLSPLVEEGAYARAEFRSRTGFLTWATSVGWEHLAREHAQLGLGFGPDLRLGSLAYLQTRIGVRVEKDIPHGLLGVIMTFGTRDLDGEWSLRVDARPDRTTTLSSLALGPTVERRGVRVSPRLHLFALEDSHAELRWSWGASLTADLPAGGLSVQLQYDGLQDLFRMGLQRRF